MRHICIFLFVFVYLNIYIYIYMGICMLKDHVHIYLYGKMYSFIYIYATRDTIYISKRCGRCNIAVWFSSDLSFLFCLCLIWH